MLFYFSKNLKIYIYFFRAAFATYVISSLGVNSELQVPAYTTAIGMQDLSHFCDLCHCSQQRQILSPLSKARDWAHILMDPSRVHYC